MLKALFYTHQVSVFLFLLIYLIKGFLLLTDKKEQLASFTKKFRVPEMIISFLFLLTGIYLLTQIPEINTFMIIKLICVFASIPLAIIGFKKSKKPLALIAVVLIIAAYGLAEMSKKRGGAKSDSTITDGKTLYEQNCRRCHGDDGKAAEMGAADLSKSLMDHSAAVLIITEGKSTMAPFKGTLTDAQINAVADYIATLKK